MVNYILDSALKHMSLRLHCSSRHYNTVSRRSTIGVCQGTCSWVLPKLNWSGLDQGQITARWNTWVSLCMLAKTQSSRLVLYATLAFLVKKWRWTSTSQDGLHRVLPYPTAEESAIHSRSWDHCRPHVSLHSEQTGWLQCIVVPSTGLHHCTTTTCPQCSSQAYQRSMSWRLCDTSTARPTLATYSAYYIVTMTVLPLVTYL